jgi:hypothetical protein
MKVMRGSFPFHAEAMVYGVSALAFARPDERELAGAMTGPALVQPYGRLENPQGREVIERLDEALRSTSCLHAAGQHDDRRHAATKHRQGQQPADRLRPVVEVDENHAVNNENQISRCKPRVGLTNR